MQNEIIKHVHLIREVRKLHEQGVQYKDIDAALDLPPWLCQDGREECFAYMLLRFVGK